MITLENDFFIAKLHPHGAALRDLVFKPAGHSVILSPAPNAFSEPHNYLGTIVGPVANRIAGAQFELDGQVYHLNQNEGANTLHGGSEGLSELDWEIAKQSTNEVTFTITLPDLHMGFPGPATFTASYKLADDALEIELSAKANHPNYFNLAPHIYFNLMGEGDISTHQLHVNADAYLPTDSNGIPIGEIKNVANTPMDYRTPRTPSLGDLDHNFCLDPSNDPALKLSAPNGVEMAVSTNQTGVQIYNAKHFDGLNWRDNRRSKIQSFSGLAIEPQAWPNALSDPDFTFSSRKIEQKSKFIFRKVSLT